MNLNSISSFIGEDGKSYVWHLRGSMKVLTLDNKGGPVVAKHADRGILEITDEVAMAGEMLFITFLTAEAYRGRTRYSWFYAWYVNLSFCVSIDTDCFTRWGI